MKLGLALSVLCAALAACSSPPERDLEAVKSARSVLAEWALVEEQAGKGRTPQTYAESMRKNARDQLVIAQSQLSEHQPAAAALIAGIATGEPDAAALHRADGALEPLEKSLESS